MTAQAQIAHSSDERTWGSLSHASALLNLFGGVGGIIAALAIWLTQREKSAWVAFQALQALVFQATVLVITVVLVGVVWVVGFIVSFATIGIGTFVAVPVMMWPSLGGLHWRRSVWFTRAMAPIRFTRAGNSAIHGSGNGCSGARR